MRDTRRVVLWRMKNGEWDVMGKPRPASHASDLLATAVEANRRAAASGSGELFAVMPEGEHP